MLVMHGPCVCLCTPWTVSDVPDKPGAPEIQDWDSNHADLVWEHPVGDGGTPIIKYVVEKRPKAVASWADIGETKDDKCQYTVTDLAAGQEIQFRVTAVNKAGTSQPSEPSKSFKAKPRFGESV